MFKLNQHTRFVQKKTIFVPYHCSTKWNDTELIQSQNTYNIEKSSKYTHKMQFSAIRMIHRWFNRLFSIHVRIKSVGKLKLQLCSAQINTCIYTWFFNGTNSMTTISICISNILISLIFNFIAFSISLRMQCFSYKIKPRAGDEN